jgi:hypothetical protein
MIGTAMNTFEAKISGRNFSTKTLTISVEMPDPTQIVPLNDNFFTFDTLGSYSVITGYAQNFVNS